MSLRQFITTHRVAVGLIGAVVALGIAVTYLFVVPAEAESSGPVTALILRYGHSFCWVLLAAASACYAARARRVVSICAYSALVAYVVFMLTLVFAKFA